MRRMYFYPEQEPGRERTAPVYEESQRMDDRRRMAYDGSYNDTYNRRMDYRGERKIGFDPYSRYSMHGGGGRGGEYEMGHGGGMHTMSERDAEEWVYSMKSADGSKAPKFKYEDVEQMLKKKGWKCDPLDVWVGMNALYSDLCEVNAKFGITAEKKDYWLEAACAYWLDDEDAVEDKLTAYYNYIVK